MTLPWRRWADSRQQDEPVALYGREGALHGVGKARGIPPLHEAGDAQILGLHPLQELGVAAGAGPRDVQVRIGAVPADGGLVGPPREFERQL